jgi:hypothetical protein
MSFVCKDCEKDSSSHSFKNIGTNEKGVTFFYTCPAKATKYDDADGIIIHYDGVLSENKTDWTWVFDGDGFSTKHLLEIEVGIKLTKLITQKYSHNLKKIIVINPSWNIKLILELLYPFLNKYIRSKIKILEKTALDDIVANLRGGPQA